MPRRPLRTLVAYTSLAVLACSPLEKGATQAGPAVRLTAAAPVVEHLVTLCADGSEIDGWRPKARLTAKATLSADSRQISVRGHVEAAGKRSAFDLTPAGSTTLELALDAHGPWSEQEGPRCGAPILVRFAAEDPTAVTQLDIDWKASFSMDEAGMPLCITTPSDFDMSVRIEPPPAS